MNARRELSATSLFWPAAAPASVPLSELPPQPHLRPVKVLHVITRFIDGSGGNTLVSALGIDRGRFEPWSAGCPEGDLWAKAEAAGIKTVKLPRFREVLAPLDDVAVLVDLVS